VVTVVVAAAVGAFVGCHSTNSGTHKPQHTKVRKAGSPGGAAVFVKPDGAQKFRATGTDQWAYGAVGNAWYA